jgi:hypothetical protein
MVRYANRQQHPIRLRNEQRLITEKSLDGLILELSDETKAVRRWIPHLFERDVFFEVVVEGQIAVIVDLGIDDLVVASGSKYEGHEFTPIAHLPEVM